jgi:hypothetical protein
MYKYLAAAGLVDIPRVRAQQLGCRLEILMDRGTQSTQ